MRAEEAIMGTRGIAMCVVGKRPGQLWYSHAVSKATYHGLAPCRYPQGARQPKRNLVWDQLDRYSIWLRAVWRSHNSEGICNR